MNTYAQIKLEDQAAAAAQSNHHFPPAPSSDSALTSSSDWSQYSSPAQSPAVPHARLARSVRGVERQRAKGEYDAVPSSPYPSYYRSPIQPPSAPVLPSPSKSKSRRIPRPPNAFILYRSSLLSKGKIPDNIERRQQTLSRVAGQCWNLLTAAQKRVWQDLAAERAAIHQLEYPDYHFKPSSRGKGKAKLRSNEDKSDDAIRALRETYVGICGPSICASRQRKSKSRAEEVKLNGDAHDAHPSTPSALSSPVSPLDTQDLGAYNWTAFSGSNSPSPSLPSPTSSSSNDPPLPPCFPQHTFPHFTAPRRPSTSLGFVRRLDEDTSCFQAGYTLERPASAASDTGLATLVRDLNITPTATNFGHISMPPTPKFYGVPYSTVDQGAIRAPFPFAALNPQFDPASGMDAEQPSANDQGNFSDPQFMMTLDDSYGFNNDANIPFSFDGWSFDQPMGSGQ
ncbi:hypothetical protein B0H17DRAFT_1196035 [Mycena rosella]|uniref:HMG box domain-containing protein n=1 Tax=Mycena rosella TaxID=1033263 RepID=A0AAD7DVC6_MYCRO|nr:hypothetical protein B0H17DRAFT_1196035 [Mycena rosella]